MPGSFPGSSRPSEESEQIVIPEDIEYDVNNEDVELQAALAASLAGEGLEAGPNYGQHAYVPRAPLPAPNLRQAPEPPQPQSQTNPSADADADPIAASAARNRALLEQMQRMQEAALREGFEEDTAAAERRRTREQEEADELERAIRESMREHGATSAEGGIQPATAPIEETTGSGTRTPRGVAGRAQERVYDDEDAELQAALRASLETMPEGYVHTTPPPAPAPSKPQSVSQLPPQPQPVAQSEPKRVSEEDGDESMDMEAEAASSPPAPPREVDKEEMRRARLARFGG